MKPRAVENQHRSDGSLRRWALAGAAWGLVSFLLDFGGLFTCHGILNRAAYEWLYRGLVLLVPTRWLRSLSSPPDGFMEYWPIWAFLPFNVLWSVILSTLAALGLRVVVHGAGRLLRAVRGVGRSGPA